MKFKDEKRYLIVGVGEVNRYIEHLLVARNAFIEEGKPIEDVNELLSRFLKIKKKITRMLRQKLSESGQYEKERDNFTAAIRLFIQMNKLTAPLLKELIDRIEVFETEGTGKNRTQRIIIYRYLGTSVL